MSQTLWSSQVYAAFLLGYNNIDDISMTSPGIFFGKLPMEPQRDATHSGEGPL